MKAWNIRVGAFLLACGISSVVCADTIRIASEGAYPPFNYVDSSNQLRGFDIDVAKALCERMKADCTFAAQDWDGIIPALLAKKFDAIVSSMQINEERAQKVSFTNRYYQIHLGLAVAQDSKIKDTNDTSFKGMVVGAASASAAAAYAEDHYGKYGADVRLYRSQDEADNDMTSGRLDAMVSDNIPLNDWVDKAGAQCCKYLGDIPNTEGDIAVAIRKDDKELRDRFNKALSAIVADGTYAKISAKYFSFDLSKTAQQ